jgi:hypothetical protein
MYITSQARVYLNNFWLTKRSKRKACVRKYGYDPILQERLYWTHGIQEKDHKDVLGKIMRNNNRFTLPLARLWAIEETK